MPPDLPLRAPSQLTRLHSINPEPLSATSPLHSIDPEPLSAISPLNAISGSANDIQPLLYLFGTSALPLEPPPRAAPAAEPAAPIPRVPLPEEGRIRL